MVRSRPTPEEVEYSHVGSMEEEQSGVGIVQAVAGGGEKDADKQAGSHSQLGRRIHSLRGGQKEKLGHDVVDPCVGTMFDLLGEADDFYNMYSWAGTESGKCFAGGN